MTTELTRNNQNNKRVFAVTFAIIVCLISGKLFFPVGKPFFVLGHCVYVVGSASMEPQYPVHSLVLVRSIPYDGIKAGDVIAFRSNALGGATALHRVVRKTEEGIITKGDANNREDGQPVTKENYIGKCVFKVAFFARYAAAVRTAGGFVVFFLLPTAACLTAVVAVKQWKAVKRK